MLPEADILVLQEHGECVSCLRGHASDDEKKYDYDSSMVITGYDADSEITASMLARILHKLLFLWSSNM